MLGLGLENRLTAKVGLLSGGQRQALTLLMATLKRPKLLLLDEHTAALDPKTAAKVLELTEPHRDASGQLTTLMITHNMRDAHSATATASSCCTRAASDPRYLGRGKEEPHRAADLLEQFTKASGDEFANDRAILSATLSFAKA